MTKFTSIARSSYLYIPDSRYKPCKLVGPLPHGDTFETMFVGILE